MMAIPTFDIDMDKKCAQCGKHGTVNNTKFCMKCAYEIGKRLKRLEGKKES